MDLPLKNKTKAPKFFQSTSLKAIEFACQAIFVPPGLSVAGLITALKEV